MNNLLTTILSDDFVWDAITSHLTGRIKRARTGFIDVNCPVCHDYKPRCGIKRSTDGIGINCFNCGFKVRWQVGNLIIGKIRQFMESLGIADDTIEKLNYKAFQYRSLIGSNSETSHLIPEFAIPSFNSIKLPKDAKSFAELADNNCKDLDFNDCIEYLYGRGNDIFDSYKYFWSSDKTLQMNRRIIIPCYFDGRIVGYSARSIDANSDRRYIKQTPVNYLFNNSVLADPYRKYVILVEGVFDAIAVDGVGILGSSLNSEQITWIKSYGKTVILLPDRDEKGQNLIDLALKHNWHIAFPIARSTSWWEKDVKDAAEASKRYGSLWTLLSIIETATNNKLTINLNRRTQHL